MSAPSYMVPPQYTSTPQPPQPPQLISPVEQAILDLTKLVGDAVVEQKIFNAQLSQKIHAVENPLEQKLDGFQSEMGHQFDSLQCSISMAAQQRDQKGEENPEEVFFTDTMVEQQCQQQGLFESSSTCVAVCPWEKEEKITTLLTEEGKGKEEGEEPQKPILQQIPMHLNPTTTAQATKWPLPVASSTDQVYILPSPATQSTPKTPSPKSTPFVLPMLQNFRKLVAISQAFSTT